MKITLCTSPHLDRSPFFDGRDRHADNRPLPFAQTFLPMGLLSIAAAVKDIAEVGIFDINKQVNAGNLPLSRDLYRQSAEQILGNDPDLVGFMTDCDSFHHVIRICSSLKALRPRVTIVLGCVHASYNAVEILTRYAFIDYIVRGEGEVAFRQLVEALAGRRAIGDVGNLSYRSGGGIERTADLALIADLDSLPWIDPDLAGLAPGDAVWVEIGRGCPFKCNFCVTAPYWQRRHRIKSPDRIIAELRMFRDIYNRRDFNFTHDLFTTDRRWVLKFCAAMKKADLGVEWTCSSRTDTLDEEQLAAMAAVGCRDIYFGVEAGSDQMQQAIDKSLNLGVARQIITLCHRYGVSTTVGFIAGLPGESAASLSGTLHEAAAYLQLDQTTVHLFGFGPYRGSTNFDAIESELVPELEFVDFPLGDLTDAENRALVQSHRDVFARYSRLAAHKQDNLVRTLEVAEEYFPILNALPALTAYFHEQGVDPYDQLCAWADWLARGDVQRSVAPRHSHLGSIADFLDFATYFAVDRGHGGDRFDEILRWEMTKQCFRSEAPETRLGDRLADAADIGVNPTIRIEQFRYAPNFAPQADPVAQSFAFLRRRNGEAEVVRVGPMALGLIDLARTGARPSDIGGEGQAAGADQAVRNIFTELTDRELIFVDR